MLTLITGLPGNGKTLYALQYVAAWAKREGRQVWYHGIKDLSPALGWKEIPTKQESLNGREVSDPKSDNVDVPQWFTLPAKSIFLIDEAQNCGFAPRMRGLAADWARKLETHRHLGIDGVFITQEPGLIDAHDRKLCELHFHVMRTFGLQRATVHEFRPVRANLTSRRGSIEHKWKFPKDVFNWYTSAEAHTHKARIPMKVWALAAIVVCLPIGAYFTWAKLLDPARFERRAAAASAAAGPASGATAVARGSYGGAQHLSTAEYLEQQQPRIGGLAYSAPVYDDVTKPAVAPYPAACVSSATRCQCYSQQGTRLDVPKQLCISLVEGGFFVSWNQQGAQAIPVPPARPLESAQVDPVLVGGVGSFGGSHARIGSALPSPSILPSSDGESLPPGRGRNLPKLPGAGS